MGTKVNVSENKTIPIFEAWKEYEKIAMHFNDLLIQLRMRAIAGIATISSVIGILIQTHSQDHFIWEIASGLFFLLLLFWIAVWILDFCYYHRLLEGAVQAVLGLEELSKTESVINQLNLSTSITKAVTKENHFWKISRISPKILFYLIVFLGLFGGFGFCLYKASARKTFPTTTTQICKNSHSKKSLNPSRNSMVGNTKKTK